MSRQQLIDQTVRTLAQLPDDKISEVLDFASFILKKDEETILQQGIQHLISSSESFAFLRNEEDLYTVEDLKKRF